MCINLIPRFTESVDANKTRTYYSYYIKQINEYLKNILIFLAII